MMLKTPKLGKRKFGSLKSAAFFRETPMTRDAIKPNLPVRTITERIYASQGKSMIINPLAYEITAFCPDSK
jgi:hypothetical protein